MEDSNDITDKIEGYLKFLSKISNDLILKIIIAAFMYVSIMLLALFIHYKLTQQSIFGLTLTNLPLWPTIKIFSGVPDDFIVKMLSVIIFIAPFIAFKFTRKIFQPIKGPIHFKKWMHDYGIVKKLPIIANVLRFIFVFLSLTVMYKAANGILQTIFLFAVNEIFYQCFFNDDNVLKRDLSGISLGSIVLNFLLTTLLMTIALFNMALTFNYYPVVKNTVARAICNEPEYASIQVDNSEKITGWLIGTVDDYFSVRRKDVSGFYETMLINKNKVVEITFIRPQEAPQDNKSGFSFCSAVAKD